jgi:hypothetical protein
MLGADALRQRVLQRLSEQRVLVQSLLRQREQLQGSLFTRYGVCGKANCACRSGAKHGPYHVLSTRGAAGGGFAYIEGEKLEAAREHVDGYRRFRRGLRKLRSLNLEIVRLLRRYQAAAARQGGRRLGLAASA